MAGTHEKPVRVRMAPSPTGHLHLGTARTALFNWLFARQRGGVFVLRIEDTDVERSKREYEEEILEGLAWLGITWDEGPDVGGPYGPYRQSERKEIYKRYLAQLLEKKEAYYCYCTKEELEAEKQALAAQGLPPKYGGRCRDLAAAPAGRTPQVIRFKVPEVKVEFHDLIRGKVSFDAGLFGDIVIAKDLDNPLYNFAVVVDDGLMEITHVIRAEDHISNTPKQILIRRALGFSEPLYAHIPLILNPDRSKMSKRFADTALLDYRNTGYLSEAMMNFLAFLGWHPREDEDILAPADLISRFDLERVQKAGAVFDQEKMNWLNREYLKKLDDENLAEALVPFFRAAGLPDDVRRIRPAVAAVRSRAEKLSDVPVSARFFFELPPYEPSLLVWKKAAPATVAPALARARAAIATVPEADFKREALSAAIGGVVDPASRGEVLWPLRVALSGQATSPDPVDIMGVLGKEESLRRIDLAVAAASGLA